MLNFKQPSTLVICALNRLVKLVHFDNGPYVFSKYSFSILQEFISSIPNNLFDQWADKLFLVSNQSPVKSESHLLIFGPFLSELNVDDFPTLPVNIVTLSDCLKSSINIKKLYCRYTPYFWSSSDILIFQNSLVTLKNLQTLVLCNLNLVESQNFLEVIGTSCKHIVELDISYGKFPVAIYETLSKNFPYLEVLRLKQHSERFRTITQREAAFLMTSLLKLKILDDDTTSWSCVYPALKQLSEDSISTSLQCARLRHLTVYQLHPSDTVNLKFTNSVASLLLDSRIFKHSISEDQNITYWMLHSFPSLLSVDLRLDNVWFTPVQTFIQTEEIGCKIHSISLTNTPLNVRQFQVIGKYATNLKRLEVTNRRTLDTDMSDYNQDVFDVPQLFCNLQHLSFTGVWNERISSLLLDHSVFLQELQLKTHTLPMEFLRCNPLVNLRRLLLDISHITWSTSIMQVYDLEKDFLQRLLPSASKSLCKIRLKSRPSKEWESLVQLFKMANCDWNILHPI